MIYVLDTSALIRFYIPDGPVPDDLEKAIRETERGNDVIVVPELIFAEVAQVLHKKRIADLLSSEEFDAILEDILALPLRVFSHIDLVQGACRLAQVFNLTVYDALFLVLAEQHSAQLLTGDGKLQAAANQLKL